MAAGLVRRAIFSTHFRRLLFSLNGRATLRAIDAVIITNSNLIAHQTSIDKLRRANLGNGPQITHHRIGASALSRPPPRSGSTRLRRSFRTGTVPERPRCGSPGRRSEGCTGVAAHETDETPIRYYLHNVAGQQCARAFRPMENGAALEVTSAPNQRESRSDSPRLSFRENNFRPRPHCPAPVARRADRQAPPPNALLHSIMDE